jgi:metal-responsive CopG/Arc/MetJ family transcriptional regulator
MATQQRRPDQPKALRKSISVTQEMVDEIQARADEEGHRNFSWVIVQAVREYLARPFRKNQEAA